MTAREFFRLAWSCVLAGLYAATLYHSEVEPGSLGLALFEVIIWGIGFGCSWIEQG